MADVWRTLARWRVPLGYVLAVAALWFAAPTWRSLALGAVIGALGEALRIWATGHLEKGREVFVYLAVTIVAAVRSEEAHLTEKFGASYPAYRDGRAQPGGRRFSFERAWRNREYRALAGFAAVFLLLAVRLLMR